MPRPNPHCRIGKITWKNVRLLPHPSAVVAKKVQAELTGDVEWTRQMLGDNLDGYALVVWDRFGCWKAFDEIGTLQHMNTLSEFVAGAIRNEQSKREARDAVRRFYNNE